MRESSWIPRVRFLPALRLTPLLLAAGLSASLAVAAPGRIARDLCRNGRPLDRVRVFLSRKIQRPGAGLALDDALEAERETVSRFRAEAERYFLDSPHELLDPIRHRYTFLFPARVLDRYGLGVPVALSESEIALKYRELLWRHYIERFTSIEEAPGRDPYSIRFKVSLDLRLYCRYRQELRDLISR